MFEKDSKRPFFTKAQGLVVFLTSLLGGFAGYVYGHQAGYELPVIFALVGFVLAIVVMGGFIRFIAS